MTNPTTTPKTCRGCGEALPADKQHMTFCRTCVTVKVHKNYTRRDLFNAFARVQDAENWKNPIDKSIEGNLSQVERDLISAAVVFYAGCVPTFTTEGGLVGVVFTRVQAVGYYAAVGA